MLFLLPITSATAAISSFPKSFSDTLRWAVAGTLFVFVRPSLKKHELSLCFMRTLPSTEMSKVLGVGSELPERIQGRPERWRSLQVWFVITLDGACDLIRHGLSWVVKKKKEI